MGRGLHGCQSRLENCPKDFGPDQDFGSPPILRDLPGGRTLLIAGQKSGNVWAYDPDKNGAVVWRTALVNNTKEFGGKIVWGGAADEQTAYFGLGTGGIGAIDIRNGERKWFTALAPGGRAHPASRTGRTPDGNPRRGFLRRLGRRAAEPCPHPMVKWSGNSIRCAIFKPSTA